MVRPKKLRRISCLPPSTFYKPAGVPMRNLPINRLNFEEVEALRLKNLQGLSNEQSAKKMVVSRATFQRILNLAYRKLSKALVGGEAIQIEGGSFYQEDK